MEYMIAIFVILFLVGAISFLKPSKKMKSLSKVRMAAAAAILTLLKDFIFFDGFKKLIAPTKKRITKIAIIYSIKILSQQLIYNFRALINKTCINLN